MRQIDVVKERFSDIKAALRLGSLPENVPACLEAVMGWVDQAGADPRVAVRAAQVLLLDPEVPGSSSRPVVCTVEKALGDAWLRVPGDGLYLLQAMILAARPEPLTGPWGAVELIGAGHETGRGREDWRKEAAPWWAMRAEWGRPAVVWEAPRLEVRAVGVSPEDVAARKEMLEALWYLETNNAQGWNYSVYAPHLLKVLDWVQGRVGKLVAGQTHQAEQLAKAQDPLEQLHKLKSGGHGYNGIAGALLPWLETLLGVLTERGADLPGITMAWRTLKTHQGQGWTFDGLSPHLLPVLTAIVHAITHLEDRRHIDALSTVLQTQSADLQRTLTASSQQLTSTLQSARPPELELVWWGQARYCHTERRPFRQLLRAPAERPRAFYAAAAEAAERAWALPPEPSAAYLVQVLSELGLDVDEQRPLSAWLQELAAQPPDAPQGPLAELVQEDPAGLPVTWARTRPAALSEEAIQTRLALPPDHLLDRGQWATWLLRERVLERRLREGQPA